jgi:nucleoside-triphosphatase THEP1
MFSKQLKKIYVYHGMSGIGKTTAFKQTINKFINENKLI